MGLRVVVCYLTPIVVGIALIVTGLVVLLDVYPKVIHEEIDNELQLRNGSDEAKRFANPPSPIYFKFYLFNVTNKDQVNNNGSDAVLEELGPYVYKENKIKDIYDWDEDNGTVHYIEHRTYHFQESMSKGKLSDVINHINAVNVAMISQLTALGLASQVPLIRGEYVETHTAKELIFDGYSMEEYFPKDIASFCSAIQNCTFAYYYEKNDTNGTDFEVWSGIKGMDNFTKIERYDDKPELTYWYGDTCNMINGTDGQQFPPRLDSDQSLYVFSDDVCRSLQLKYEKPITVQGIRALRYVIPDVVFADPNKVKDNMCFCQNVSSPDPCPSKAGVILLQKCQDGKPVMASNPHFYQGEPDYWQKYKGLFPNKDKHQTFLDIEPLTGMVISAAKRIQISILVIPDDRPQFLKFIHNVTYFPAFWVEEGGEIDPDTAAEFRRRVIIPVELGYWGSIVAIAVGAILVLAAAVVFLWKCLPSKNNLYERYDPDEVDSSNVAKEKGSINQKQDLYGATSAN